MFRALSEIKSSTKYMTLQKTRFICVNKLNVQFNTFMFARLLKVL